MDTIKKNESLINKNENDSEIIDKILKGEKSLFAVLVNKYESLLFGYVLARVRYLSEVQDIVQETFLKAYKHLNSFNPQKKFSCWLITIAKNLIYNHLKKNSCYQKIIEDCVEYGSNIEINKVRATEPQNQVIKQEEIQEIFRNILELPEDLRLPLILKIINDMTYEEISEHLEVNVQIIKNRIFKARQILRSKRKDKNEV